MVEKPKHIRFTDDIKAEVISLLKWEFSPEQITGLAQREKRFCVSHEAIYEYLGRQEKRRRFAQVSATQGAQIPETRIGQK